MKKLICTLVFLLLAASVSAQTYFQDDFEDPDATADKWEIILGDWEVNDGIFQQTGQGIDPWLVAMVSNDYWNMAWTEYTIEFKVRNPVDGLDNGVSVLFRVQDPVPPNWDERRGANSHVYRWGLNIAMNSNGVIGVYEPGTYTRLVEAPNSLVIGEWHGVKLEVTESIATAYIDDKQVLETDDVRWTEGRVGIQAYDGPLDFGDFIVYGPAGAVVEPDGKTAATWGQIKKEHANY
jgi:hypothetical protein